MRHGGHQVDEHIINRSNHSLSNRVVPGKIFIRKRLPGCGDIETDDPQLMLFDLFFQRYLVTVTQPGQAIYLLDQ